MITPEDIVAKAARAYVPWLRTWLRGEPFVPLELPAGAPPADFRTLERVVGALLDQSRQQRGAGYTVEMQTRATRSFGQQSLPTRIHVPSAADLLALIGKTAEFDRFAADVALIRATLPALEPWLAANVQQIIAYHGVWPELLEVCGYVLANQRPNVYMRELPIAVHTKFVEQHTPILTRLLDALLPAEAVRADEKTFERRFGLRFDAPLIRIRLLDDALQQRLGVPFADIATPTAQLATLPGDGLGCLVVENKMVFLTLPPVQNTIAIFGSGFQVELLREVPWLRTCPIWYWGDLDAHGFQILARLRALFPQVVSLMMDDPTFDTFRTFAVAGTPSATVELPALTAVEHMLFANLVRSNLRLEQERIGYAYAVQQIRAAIGNA